jgi:hypothetical protein
MDAQSTSFWQSVALFVLGLLQTVVNLVVWEKHQPVDTAAKTGDTIKQ